MLQILQLGNEIHSNESSSHFYYCVYVAINIIEQKRIILIYQHIINILLSLFAK